MRANSERALKWFLVALAALAVPACGGGDGGGGGPTTPTGPTQAQVTVSYTDLSWDEGGFPGFNYSIQFTITIRETAGVGIKGNFLRVDFYSGANGTGSFLTRQEVGGNILGHMNGGASESETLIVGFNRQESRSFVLTFNVTDDRGNTLTNTQAFNLSDFPG